MAAARWLPARRAMIELAAGWIWLQQARSRAAGLFDARRAIDSRNPPGCPRQANGIWHRVYYPKSCILSARLWLWRLEPVWDHMKSWRRSAPAEWERCI